MVKMTPACFAIPFIIYSFAIYLITDLRADAFELPSPLWYVCMAYTLKSKHDLIYMFAIFFFVKVAG